MEQQEKQQYRGVVHRMLTTMVGMKASDLFITAGFPPAVKLNGKVTKLNDTPLTAEQTQKMAHSIATEKQWQNFIDSKGSNFAIALEGVGRFRINIFTQQQRPGMVIRVITTEIPDFDKMNLPPILKSVVLEKRGLVLLVGGTGSGKSTTLAAMLGVRNRETHGHIITIEDPVEYVHTHINCIVTHREVGVDTVGWFDALKDTLRQAPDVILIGEIRDQETMEYALNFAETGHLCMATLHANSANQAIDRIVNFFPIEKREQVLNDISLNMRAIISQRLVRKISGGRVAAIEVLLSTATSRDAIAKGEVGALKEIMKKSVEQGMKTFDQCLFELYDSGEISLQELQLNSDAKGDLMLRLKLQSARFTKEVLGGDAGSQSSELSFDGQVDKEKEAAEKKAEEEAMKEALRKRASGEAATTGASPLTLELSEPPHPLRHEPGINQIGVGMDEFEAIEDRFSAFAKLLIEDAAERFKTLRGCSFFDPIPDEWLVRIADMANIRIFHSDVCLTSQDEETKAFYVILFGTAEAYCNGKLVGTIETGECIGEGIFFSDGNIASSATVIADYKIIAAEFSREAIDRLRADADAMACIDKALLRALFNKLQGANRKIERLLLTKSID